MSQSERKARNFISAACAEYNGVVRKREQKTVVEFYQHLLDLWKEQTTAQSTFQPWWDRRGDSFDDDEEEDEYYDSDNSSYVNPMDQEMEESDDEE